MGNWTEARARDSTCFVGSLLSLTVTKRLPHHTMATRHKKKELRNLGPPGSHNNHGQHKWREQKSFCSLPSESRKMSDESNIPDVCETMDDKLEVTPQEVSPFTPAHPLGFDMTYSRIHTGDDHCPRSTRGEIKQQVHDVFRTPRMGPHLGRATRNSQVPQDNTTFWREWKGPSSVCSAHPG